MGFPLACKLFMCLGVCAAVFPCSCSFPDQGQSSVIHTSVPYAYIGAHKSLYAGSTISISISCEPHNASNKVDVGISWILRQTSCFAEYLGSDIYAEDTLKIYHRCPMNTNGFSSVRYFQSVIEVVECTPIIQLPPQNVTFTTVSGNTKFPSNCIPEINVAPTGENALPYKQGASPGSSGTLMEGIKILDHGEQSQVKKRSISNLSSPGNQSHAVYKKGTLLEQQQKVNLPLQNMDGNSSLNQAPTHSSFPKYNTKHGFILGEADSDGIYLFVMKIESLKGGTIDLTVDVTMKGNYGFLSAVDFPLLIFYGFMCGIYALYACAWLIVSALQWRDLLRIQFWIGGVILLGLIEKAVFYAEYQSINATGLSVQGAVLFAEILSCMKRTLARMLVIIVSLGFGIVKPRLGSTLHQVVGMGIVYFVLGVIEGCLRVLKPKSDPNNQALIAGIPLAVIDSIICWWIFSSLTQTMRTLRLRRNLVKLQLYRHFTNTLIFAVIASVVYMVWSIHSHKLVTCIADWKELWVDEAFWHLLFSLILLVIMILLWPTNNNQRYAFTPLLDAVDDEDDDFDQSLTNDAFGMKMRSTKVQSSSSPNQNDVASKEEDDLKWVEENIPSSLPEAALPTFLDSDEEIMTVKFERSKME